ncbi:MAG: AAA family ATPase [Desulfurococcaceae archaeon]
MVKIVISGPPGSGKTTQAKLVAEKYGLKYFSAGAIFREIAEKKKLSIEELSLLAMRDPSIDLSIDEKTFEIAKKHDNIVIDGHLTAWIVSDLVDLKIYITAPLSLRILRISARDGKPIEKALVETITREYTQKARFMEYYGIDVDDISIFDLVINTRNIGVNETFQIISNFMDMYLKSHVS